MIIFLPKLELLYLFIICSSEMKSVQKPFLPTFLLVFLNCIDDFLACKLFEISKHVTNSNAVFYTYNQMQMIGHQHPSINIKSLVCLTILQRINHNMFVKRTSEYIHPINHSRSDEIQFAC